MDRGWFVDDNGLEKLLTLDLLGGIAVGVQDRTGPSYVEEAR